jgi:hypothetical protein
VEDRLNNYSYSPKAFTFHGVPDNGLYFGPNNGLYFGIELEVNGDATSQESTLDFVDYTGKVYMYPKSDSSINAGFEICFQPMSYDFIVQEFDTLFSPILDQRKNGLRSYEDGSCGIHIHTPMEAWSVLQNYRLHKLFKDAQSLILCISQRRVSDFDRWASIETDNKIIYKNATKKKRHANTRYLLCCFEYTKTTMTCDVSEKTFLDYIQVHAKKFPYLTEYLVSKDKIKGE